MCCRYTIPAFGGSGGICTRIYQGMNLGLCWLSYTAIAPEVRAGFEPALIGFANQRLRPLGYLTIWESRRDLHSQSSV